MNRVQVFGHGTAEVKIYPLRRKGTRYRSYQVSWYELGERRTKMRWWRSRNVTG